VGFRTSHLLAVLVSKHFVSVGRGGATRAVVEGFGRILARLVRHGLESVEASNSGFELVAEGFRAQGRLQLVKVFLPLAVCLFSCSPALAEERSQSTQTRSTRYTVVAPPHQPLSAPTDGARPESPASALGTAIHDAYFALIRHRSQHKLGAFLPHLDPRFDSVPMSDADPLTFHSRSDYVTVTAEYDSSSATSALATIQYTISAHHELWAYADTTDPLAQAKRIGPKDTKAYVAEGWTIRDRRFRDITLRILLAPPALNAIYLPAAHVYTRSASESMSHILLLGFYVLHTDLGSNRTTPRLQRIGDAGWRFAYGLLDTLSTGRTQ